MAKCWTKNLAIWSHWKTVTEEKNERVKGWRNYRIGQKKHYLSVWPDVGTKSSPIFTTLVQKKFSIKSITFRNSPKKLLNILATFGRKFCLRDPLKIDQSCHTAFYVAGCTLKIFMMQQIGWIWSKFWSDLDE